MKSFYLALILLLPTASLQADDRVELFENFWGSKLAPECSVLKAELIRKVDRNDPATPIEAKHLHDRLWLSGGVVSWADGNTWNILMLEELAELSLLTNDALDFMLCHELGHFMAKDRAAATDPNAEEFAADAFALRECLPKYWPDDGSAAAKKAFRARARKAVASASEYLRYFLEKLSLGSSDEDMKTVSCREKSAFAVIDGKPKPRCARKYTE